MQRKRRSSFSDEQLRQLKSANENLRRLNHAALSQLQHIANSYFVVFGTICGSCDDPLDEPQDDVPEVLKLDVAQLAEIDCLVELAQHIEERVSARCMSRDNLLKAFITGLSRLTRALLRQRRHLLDSAPEQNVKIEVQRDRSGRCIHCNKPVAVDQQQGSRN